MQDVRHLTGLSKTTVYALMADAKFPASVKLAERATAWVEREVSDWIAARVAERNSVALQ